MDQPSVQDIASPPGSSPGPDSRDGNSKSSASRPSASNAAHLARIRDNQRRSRARRKEYLNELEDKFRRCEQLGVEASSEMQQAAKRVLEENLRLRAFLRSKGFDDTEMDSYNSPASPDYDDSQHSSPTPTFPSSNPQFPSAVSGLESLLTTRKPCCVGDDGSASACKTSTSPVNKTLSIDTDAAFQAALLAPNSAFPSATPISAQHSGQVNPSRTAFPQSHSRQQSGSGPARNNFGLSSTPSPAQTMPMFPTPSSATMFMPQDFAQYAQQQMQYQQQTQQAASMRSQNSMPISTQPFDGYNATSGQNALYDQMQMPLSSDLFFEQTADTSDLLPSRMQSQFARGLHPDGMSNGGISWKQEEEASLWAFPQS